MMEYASQDITRAAIMHLRHYRYSEFPNQPNFLEVKAFNVENVNLIVGQNASGKSRVLHSIIALGTYLRQGQPMTWRSGYWDVNFEDGLNIIEVSLQVEDGKVIRERFAINGEDKLLRASVDGGHLWYEKQNAMVDFAIPETVIAMVARRDQLQHSYLEILFRWAERARLYYFSTDLGRQLVYFAPSSDGPNADNELKVAAVADPNAVVEQYYKGCESLGDDFDTAILDDMRSVGYDCERVDSVHASNMPFIEGKAPVILALKERDLEFPTSQFQMSTGMFRALAIVIHLNYALMSKVETTILIDDIGEGLDFARAKGLINLVIDKTLNTRVQVIISSNDRFVMNEVSLDHWHVLTRSGGTITVYDKSNSADKFAKFKYLGLSNFDFFANGAFRQETAA